MLAVVLRALSHALAERVRLSVRRARRQETRLRVGVDIRPFYEPLTGIGWYLYHLLHEIAKRDDVELFLFGDARVGDEGPRLYAGVPPSAHLCWFDLRGLGRISRPARALTAGAYVIWMKLAACDVFFGPNYFLPRLLAAVAERRVITIHDLTYKRFPELLQKETLDNLERHMKREIAHADAIICVSEATRQELLTFYQLDPHRAVTIHSGTAPHPRFADPLPADAGRGGTRGAVPSTRNPQPATRDPRPATRDPQPATRDPQPATRYVLFVSTIEPRKNLSVLLDAFERLRARGAYDGELVVVGQIGWKSESIVPRLRRPGVRHLDYLDPDALADIYAGAELFVFPSIYEGFGFPLLEAMAHGIPSIAARSSSLPEIGGDAAVYFDPRDSRELEAQIERVLRDDALRAELARRGRERAALFRWADAAAKTVDVLRRAAL